MVTDNLPTLRAATVPPLAVHTAEDLLAGDSVARAAGEDGHSVVVLFQHLHLPGMRRRRDLKLKSRELWH